jgi:hypothetical protein
LEQLEKTPPNLPSSKWMQAPFLVIATTGGEKEEKEETLLKFVKELC